jgi:hypothetical protein
MTTRPVSLTPEMLLFEIVCMCSQHGIPVRADNPGAAVTHAERLLQTLGVLQAPEPPAITATATLPAVPADEPLAAGDPRPGWNLHLPTELPAVRPIATPKFERGRAAMGAHRVLRLAPEGETS